MWCNSNENKLRFNLVTEALNEDELNENTFFQLETALKISHKYGADLRIISNNVLPCMKLLKPIITSLKFNFSENISFACVNSTPNYLIDIGKQDRFILTHNINNMDVIRSIPKQYINYLIEAEQGLCYLLKYNGVSDMHANCSNDENGLQQYGFTLTLCNKDFY